MTRIFVLLLLATNVALGGEPRSVRVWPGKAPGETAELPPESDIGKPDDAPVGDRRIIKLANVSTPELAIYQPSREKNTGAAVIVCPGGGHHILAYDHEGTEVAEWLTTLGVTGIVLKYRVPARDPNQRWLAAVQDAQRSVSLVRHRASEWGIDTRRIGMLGFSAGGEVAALTAILHSRRQYPVADEIDQISARPDFAALIYPGGLLEKDEPKLRDHVRVPQDAPPMFFAHAFNDRVDVMNSVLLAGELKKIGVPAELHLYATGGHGFGMRKTGHPCNTWPQRCEEWMRSQGWLKKS